MDFTVMDKKLIIYTSFGEGHRIAAVSLKDSQCASCCNILDFSHPFIKFFYTYSNKLVTRKLPFLWKFIFVSARYSFVNMFIQKVNRFLFSPFIEYLIIQKPKVIITTHFFPLPFVSYLKERLDLKIISIVTELRVHNVWANGCVDFYFVAHEEGKVDLISSGVQGKKIINGFVPLRRGFFEKSNQISIRDKLDFDKKPCLLFISSMRGRFSFIKETIAYLKERYNIIIIYGSNIKLKKYLENLNFTSIKYFPYYENVWEFISISSVIIGKPGGLTIFEGLYKKKPFIFTDFTPGHEKANMDLLIKYGVARFVDTQQKFIESIDFFIKNKYSNSNYPITVNDINISLKKVINRFKNDGWHGE
jgi:processive 1,2-diacylglycerol beta-glucosyltransferase